MEQKSNATGDELANRIESDAAGEQLQQPPPAEPKSNPYAGLAAAPFSAESIDVLLGPIDEDDVEIRPDGLIYLPEIKYRRTLNRAFGPGAWSLLPIEIQVSPADNMLYYKGALFVLGRFVSESIGEQQYFPDNDRMSYATAAESAKSNCLMRCCKDLGIASECWDPTFVRNWIARNAQEVWCINIGTRDKGKKKKMWRKKSSQMIDMYPWKEEVSADWTPAGDVAVTNGHAPSDQRALPPATTPAPASPAPTSMAGVAAPSKKDPPPQRTPVEAKQSTPDKPVVSEKQAKRFRAIGHSNGWLPQEMHCLLGKFGCTVAEEITRDAYERVCAALENRDTLNEIRIEVENEYSQHDDGLPF